MGNSITFLKIRISKRNAGSTLGPVSRASAILSMKTSFTTSKSFSWSRLVSYENLFTAIRSFPKAKDMTLLFDISLSTCVSIYSYAGLPSLMFSKDIYCKNLPYLTARTRISWFMDSCNTSTSIVSYCFYFIQYIFFYFSFCIQCSFSSSIFFYLSAI